MAGYEDAFETLADDDMWFEVAAALGGFMAPTVARNMIEPNTGFDFPDEAYGVAVAAGGQYSPMYSNQISVGGGMYALDKALERFDLKQSINSLGGT